MAWVVRLLSVVCDVVSIYQRANIFGNVFAPCNSAESWAVCVKIWGKIPRWSTWPRKLNGRGFEQVALLSQRGDAMLRVIAFAYLAKSLKVTQGHSKWHCWVGRMQVPVSISLKLCRHLVPFLRYSASKNSVNLKSGVGVVQGHWIWRRSTDHVRLSVGTTVQI